MPKFLTPNPSFIFSRQQTCYILFAKTYQINIIQIVMLSNGKEGIDVFCLEYALVYAEGHNITTISKLTYAK